MAVKTTGAKNLQADEIGWISRGLALEKSFHGHVGNRVSRKSLQLRIEVLGRSWIADFNGRVGIGIILPLSGNKFVVLPDRTLDPGQFMHQAVQLGGPVRGNWVHACRLYRPLRWDGKILGSHGRVRLRSDV